MLNAFRFRVVIIDDLQIIQWCVQNDNGVVAIYKYFVWIFTTFSISNSLNIVIVILLHLYEKIKKFPRYKILKYNSIFYNEILNIPIPSVLKNVWINKQYIP